MTRTSVDLVRILIADDHPIFCAGLRTLLEAERGFAVVGVAHDGLEAARLAASLKPDVALLDLAMPRMDGLDALRKLTPHVVGSRVIILTAAISRQQIVEALQFGAHGVVLKDAATDLLFRGIRAVMAGQYWVGRGSVSDLVAYLRSETARQTDRQKFGLTARERQVLTAVVDGLTNRDIARRFSVSEDTVKHHLSSVFDKVGVSNRLELAVFAIEHEIVDRRQTA